jgi:RND family efflux transporter MFP subunit
VRGAERALGSGQPDGAFRPGGNVKRAAWIAVALVVAVAVGRQIYLRAATEGSSSRRGTPAVAVEVAPVQRADVRDVKVFTGSLFSRARFSVAPKVSGRLVKLLVNVGDTVTNGELVAVLDDEEFARQAEQAEAELNVARASLEESRSALEIAGRELERTTTLRQKKIISQSELDAAQAEYNAQVARHKVAIAQVSQKEAALEAARVRLSYTRIHASWKDGGPRVVGEKFAEEGDMLSQGSPIVSVLDISSLTAVIHLTEGDYYRVRKGMGVMVSTGALPGRGFAGEVARIAPLLKETSREARVEIDVPNGETLLKPGMFVRVEVEFRRREGATVVPLGALVSRGGVKGVFTADMEAMRAGFVPVTVGIVDGGRAEVVEPPLSGWVVTLGQHLLEDGSSISVPDFDRKAPPAGEAAKGGREPGT